METIVNRVEHPGPDPWVLIHLEAEAKEQVTIKEFEQSYETERFDTTQAKKVFQKLKWTGASV